MTKLALTLLMALFVLCSLWLLAGGIDAASSTLVSLANSDIGTASVSIEAPTPTPSPEINRSETTVREPTAEEALNFGLGSADFDCDGLTNVQDNCPTVYNPDQKDGDGNRVGDACDPKVKGSKRKDRRCDIDNDGVYDDQDNCPGTCNPGQKDSDKNGIGDACDPHSPSRISQYRCPAKPAKNTRSK